LQGWLKSEQGGLSPPSPHTLTTGTTGTAMTALYALRTLEAHGMDDAALQTIYRSVIIAKLTNASSNM